jgi:hypothetical protein
MVNCYDAFACSVTSVRELETKSQEQSSIEETFLVTGHPHRDPISITNELAEPHFNSREGCLLVQGKLYEIIVVKSPMLTQITE